MSIAREVSLKDFSAFLNRKAEDLARLNFQPILKVCALIIKADVKERFVEANAPDGTPWLPLKRPSKKRGGKTAKPLRDTGLLMASITSYAQGHIEEVTRSSLTVGSALEYAAFQDRGTRTIPARPFAGFSAKALGEIDEALADYLEQQAL